MRFELARERLVRLPTPLPPPRPDIEAHIVRPGPLPRGARRDSDAPSRDAAALVLLYPDRFGEAHIVLMLRPAGDHVHADQVALPGTSI